MTPHPPSLQSARLHLAALQVHQAGTLAKLADDPSIAANTANFPSPYTLETAEKYIAQSSSSFTTDGNLVLGIHLRESEALLGIINLRKSPLHHNGTFGYWIAAHARDQGFASEALITLMHHGFHELGLVRMQSQCFARNLASARTMEKAGLLLEGCMKGAFVKNGVREDMLVYGVLRHAWPLLHAGKAGA